MTTSPALADLAAFAHEMLEGKHSEKYVSDLPIGYGKTTGFLLPFAIQCAKRDRSQGIIVACERKEQVIQYAQGVNKEVGRDVAFPLVGHDPLSCPLAEQGKNYNPKKCSSHHKRYAERAKDYPLLFLTHSMLALKGDASFQTWTKRATNNKHDSSGSGSGERGMVIIDERPTSWWRPGVMDEERLSSLNQLPYRPKAISSAMKEVKKALQTLLPGSNFRLSTRIAPQHILPLLLAMEDDKDLRETLETLWSLGETPGRMTREDGIVIAYSKPLPTLPTLILDGTAGIDPMYDSSRVRPIPQSPIIHTNEKHVILETWDDTMSKSIEKDDARWNDMLKGILRVRNGVHGEVFVVGALKHRPSVEGAFTMPHLDRLVFSHYGATKGSNDYDESVAVVCFTTPFKPSHYYQALGGGRDVKLRDTVTELIQQAIGRTAIRKDAPCTIRVLIPWGDKPGVKLLKEEIHKQWGARVSHTVLQKKPIKESKCQLLAKLKAYMAPGETIDRAELAFQLKMKLPTFTKALERNKEVLCMEGFTYTRSDVHRVSMKLAA